MRLAETVCFGGSALDRAAEIRGDAEVLAAARGAPGARAVALWRGKPLFAGEAQDRLVRLALDSPALEAARGEAILLGREDGGAVFACDVSGWVPEGQDVATVGNFFDPSGQHHPALPGDHLFTEIRANMARLSPRDAELAATAKAIFGWHRTHRFCAACGAESVMAMAGWQRDCPACGAHHFPRTDPVVIMLITRGDRVLLGRSPHWPEGMFSLLAGFVEPGETIEAAVRREVWEESRVRVGRVDYLSSQPWPFPASLMMGCRGEALSEEITVDPVELEAARWVTKGGMMEAVAGRHPDIRPPRRGAIAEFLLRNWLADRLD